MKWYLEPGSFWTCHPVVHDMHTLKSVGSKRFDSYGPENHKTQDYVLYVHYADKVVSQHAYEAEEVSETPGRETC